MHGKIRPRRRLCNDDPACNCIRIVPNRLKGNPRLPDVVDLERLSFKTSVVVKLTLDLNFFICNADVFPAASVPVTVHGPCTALRTPSCDWERSWLSSSIENKKKITRKGGGVLREILY